MGDNIHVEACASTCMLSSYKSSRSLSHLLMSSCIHCHSEFWPVTLTFELDLHRVTKNHHVKHLGQRSFRSKVISYIHTHIVVSHVNCDTHTANPYQLRTSSPKTAANPNRNSTITLLTVTAKNRRFVNCGHPHFLIQVSSWHVLPHPPPPTHTELIYYSTWSRCSQL